MVRQMDHQGMDRQKVQKVGWVEYRMVHQMEGQMDIMDQELKIK
jgi:hypothetical protein